MSTINDSDQFLVQRGTTSHKLEAVNLMSTIQDSDQMLIQRGTDSYKVSCEDVKNQLGGPSAPPVVASAALTQNQTNANRFTSNSFTTTVTATESPTKLQMKAKVVGALTIEAGSYPIVTNDYNGSGGIPLTLSGDSTADFSAGDVVQANVSYTPVSSEITSVNELTSLVTVTNWQFGENVLDGNTATQASSWNLDATTGLWGTIEFETPIEVTQFEVYTRIYTSTNRLQLLDADGNVVREKQNLASSTGWRGIYDDATAPLMVKTYRQQVEVGGQQTSDDFYAVKINNELLICKNRTRVSQLLATGDKSSGSVELEFTDETNLQYFQAGDVVQTAGTGNPAWNETQVWSANASDVGMALPWSGAFTGVINGTFAAQTGASSSTCTFTQAVAVGSGIRLAGGAGKVVEITFEDGASVFHTLTGYAWSAVPGSSGAMKSITIPDSTAISGIEISGKILVNGTEVKAISVDPANNKMVVSGGEWAAPNYVRDWVNSITTTAYGGQFLPNPPYNIFDGNLTTNCHCNADGLDTTVTLTFSPPMAVTTGVSFYGVLNDTSGLGAATMSVTDSAGTTFPGQQIKIAPSSYISGERNFYAFVGNISKITLIRTQPHGGLYAYGFSVDDNLLINSTESPSTEVTGPLKRGNGTIESITGTAVTINPFTDNCFVDGQWLTQTTPIQVTPLSEPIATVVGNTIIFDDPEGLLNFATGDAVTMCDAAGNPASVTYESSEIINVGNFNTSTITNVVTGTAGLNWDMLFNGNVGPTNAGVYYFQTAGDIQVRFSGGSAIRLVCSYMPSSEFTLTGPFSGSPVTLKRTGSVSDGVGLTIIPTVSNGSIAITFNDGMGGQHNFILPASVDTYSGGSYANLAALPIELTFQNDDNLDQLNGGQIVQLPYARVCDLENIANDKISVAGGNWYGTNGTGSAGGDTIVKTSNQIPLTFANGTNLDKFPDGTVVQGSLNWSAPYNTLVNLGSSPVTYDVNANANWANSISGFTGTVDYFIKDAVGLTLDLTQVGFIYWTSLDGVNWTQQANTPSKVFTFTTPYAMVGGSFISPGLTYSAATVTDDSDIGNNKLTVSGGNWATASSSAAATVLSAMNVNGYWAGDGSSLPYYSLADINSTISSQSYFTSTAEPTGNVAILLSTSSNYLEFNYTVPTAGDQILFRVRGGTDADTSGWQVAITGDATNESYVGTGGKNQTTNSMYVTTTATSGTFRLTADDSGCMFNYWEGFATVIAESKLSRASSGTGTVGTVDAPNSQITLSTNNNQWIVDYHMKGPTKNVVEKTAYLQFNAQGTISNLLRNDPGVVLMGNITTPVLTFPAQFLAGQTPDAELPLPTYLQTEVSAGNSIGDSPFVLSNILYPTTATYSIAANSSRMMAEEFTAFCATCNSYEVRAAETQLQTAQQRADHAHSEVEARIDNYLNSANT